MKIGEAIRIMTHRKHLLMMATVSEGAKRLIEKEVQAINTLIETSEKYLRRNQ